MISFMKLKQVASLKSSIRLSSGFTKSELKDGVFKIVLCHAKTRNSLSIEMMEHLLQDINQHSYNKELRVIVLGAEGPVFSAGHNLKELIPGVGRKQHEKVFKLASTLMNTIIDAPVPIIAAIDGLAAAAGCQLVAQCDLAVCTQESSFSTPGANFGIFCSTPGVALARCVPKATALKMLLTGNSITSNEAKTAGLVTEVCSKENLDAEVNKLCDAIKAKSRSVIEIGKKFYYKQVTEDVKTAYQLGGKVMVDNVNIPDGIEGVTSFAEKRKPKWGHK